MTAAASDETPDEPRARTRPGRGRRILVDALIVLAALMLFIAAWATLISQGILNPDKWSETSRELLENDEVRTAVSRYVVSQLYSPEAVAQQLEGALPPAAAGLSSAIASGLGQVATEAVDRVLARPRVVDVWAAANRATMEAVDRLIDNKGEFVSLQGNEVVLDVRALLAEVGAQLGGSGQLVDRIPPDAGQIVVLQSDQLSVLQKIIKALRTVSFWFAIGGGLLFGLAVYLARGWRREALRSISISLIVVALLVLVIRRFVGNGIIDSLVADATNKAAALGTWAIATEALKAAALGAMVLGLIGVLVTALLGPARWAVSTRRRLAPHVAAHRWVGYVVVLLVGLLFLLWSPTQRASWVPAVVVMAILAAGYEALLRQCAREFPAAASVAEPVEPTPTGT